MTASIAPAPRLLLPHEPTPSQREAIEAAAGPLLVLAGPGAGKTYCLIERIRFLIERLDFDPERICAFTFTNKAAGEIEHRLEARLGARAARIKRGTIHAFCAELLRELGSHVLLDKGFGIADEEYQLSALRRIEGPRRWHRHTLTRFSAHRFRGDPLLHNDSLLFERYERFLAERRLVDFDTLVIKAAELLDRNEGAAVRSRWDVVLVDEFQDLNPVQYRVVRALAKDHHHVFAVGDDEQSIYSWAGADPLVFRSFVNDFGITSRVHLEENRRCPREVFALARRLVMVNTPIFADRVAPRADKICEFPPAAIGFDDDDAEMRWIVDDIRRDRGAHRHAWGDVALLYRKHEIGERLEAAFLNAGIPCRLAQGRALADDPIVGYVLAALRVIANPNDDLLRDAFLAAVLPKALFDHSRARAEAGKRDLGRYLSQTARRLPRAHEDGRQIRRALTDWRNLAALGRRHATVGALVQELLSRRVGRMRSVLDDRHDEISDPQNLPDVVALADRLRRVRLRDGTIWMPRMAGVEVALKGMLGGVGFGRVVLAGDPPAGEVGCGTPSAGAERRSEEPIVERIGPDDAPSLGIALGLFKALQLLEMEEHEAAFRDFTAIDLETTGRDTSRAEIVQIAAVRVRDGRIVDELDRLVKPGVPIDPAAQDTHGISESDVADAPDFGSVWPEFRAFCGDDVIVAHNGYDFDFRILARMARTLGAAFDLCTYDSLPLARDLFPTSRKLEHLAGLFGIPTGRSHHAIDDTRALAQVVIALDAVKLARARKTALVNLLDHLGIALALSSPDALGVEATMFRGITRGFALGRYTTCLEAYEREQGDDISIPTVDEVIERLGGADLMLKIRAEKSADERYPQAMLRLRRILSEMPPGSLSDQLSVLLERASLSKWEGHEPERTRVNLLTLHSTKGLEFSRVYVVGVEDAQMPGGSPTTGPTKEEIEEARRLLYVGMTRTQDRLVLTRSVARGEKPTGGHRFLDEMGLTPAPPARAE